MSNASNNWTREDLIEKSHKKAIELEKAHKRWEKGKTITHSVHPNSIRCEILKYE